MENLMKYKGKQVETIVVNDVVYFNPYHVGQCLELSDSAVRKAIGGMTTKQAVKLTNSDVKKSDIRKLNNAGELFLTESGVYKLAFRSNKPEAEAFTNWVSDDVLPTIRKTGSYNISPIDAAALKCINAETKEDLIFGLREYKQAIVAPLHKELTYKEDVIIGLTKDITLAEKRQRINQIVRHCSDRSSETLRARWSRLYDEFERKYHCNLSRRLESYKSDFKPKLKNKVDVIDRQMGMIPELYEICCKLFENDVQALLDEWKSDLSDAAIA